MKRIENPYAQLPIDRDVAPENVTPSIPHHHMQIGDSIFLHPDQLKISLSRIHTIIRGWAYGENNEVIKCWGYRREDGGIRVWRLPTSDYHLPIERVPIPKNYKRIGRVLEIPHEQMAVGESVFIPEGWLGYTTETLQKLGNTLTRKYKNTRKFITRREVDAEGRTGYRVWRISLENTEEKLQVESEIPPPGEDG